MNIQGFLRWQFSGCFQSISFYGMLLTFLGLAMVLGGCPMPWPAIVSMLGIILVMADMIYAWFRFSYSVYELERNNTINKLKTKE